MEKIIQKLIANPKKSILATCIALTLLLIRHQHKKLLYIPGTQQYIASGWFWEVSINESIPIQESQLAKPLI